MANDLITPDIAGIPDWLRKRSTGAAFGNLDPADLKPPRLKMLAGMSPEVMNGVPGASPGNFWMTILDVNLGREVVGTPIWINKTYQVWAPRTGNDSKGPLASSSNGIVWDVPNQTFDVRFPNNPKIYKWRIGKLVTDFGATKWGSQMEDDPSSKPIATKTYNVIWLIDLPKGGKQLCVFTNAKTAVDRTEKFASTVQTIGVDFFYQRYAIVARQEKGGSGDLFWTYEYRFAGTLTDDAECDYTRSLYNQYKKAGFTGMEAGVEEEPEKKAPRFEATDSTDEIPF